MPLRTLRTPGALDEIVNRMAAFEPARPRLWGKMEPGQMVRHLLYASQAVLDDQIGSGSWTPMKNRFGRWFAFGTDLRWPKNLPTVPELKRMHEQPCDPAVFHAERDQLIATTRQLAAASTLPAEHPLFGAFTPELWMRWAYLHADHHLRQFSS